MQQRMCLFFLFILAACQPAVAVPKVIDSPTQPVPVETVIPSPIPSATFVPTPTPTFDELIYPYTVEGLRQHNYRSGEIHIRSTLNETDTYIGYLIDYPSDGLTITGVMQIPKGAGPFPVIVMNHGFFTRSAYHSGDGTDRTSAYLAEHGYITLASDYRSWGGSELGESLFYSGLVIDVINLIDAIPSIPQADSRRVGIWGHSMGGGVTMKVLTVIGGLDTSRTGQLGDSTAVVVKAAVLYSTVSADFADIIARWGNGCFGDIAQGEQVVGCNSSDVIPVDLPQNLQDMYRLAGSNADDLQKISPLYHLDFVDVPIQIHYGTEDGKVLGGTPPQWSVKLTQALRDSGKAVEMYSYEGERHSFIGEPWFVFMGRVLRFFDKYVK